MIVVEGEGTVQLTKKYNFKYDSPSKSLQKTQEYPHVFEITKADLKQMKSNDLWY